MVFDKGGSVLLCDLEVLDLLMSVQIDKTIGNHQVLSLLTLIVQVECFVLVHTVYWPDCFKSQVP